MSDDMADSSNGQDKRLSISRCWVQLPHPSPIMLYGGCRLMVGHQIVALGTRVQFPSTTPHGQVCIVAIAADCKSVT